VASSAGEVRVVCRAASNATRVHVVLASTGAKPKECASRMARHAEADSVLVDRIGVVQRCSASNRDRAVDANPGCTSAVRIGSVRLGTSHAVRMGLVSSGDMCPRRELSAGKVS
jgi:hypothetical protein